MKTDILIRPYQANDELACLEAFKSNVPLYFAENELEDYVRFLALYKSVHMQPQGIPTTYYFVLLYQQQIVACGGFGDRYIDGNLTLTWGLVHHSFHKMGFGKALLLYRLNRIKELFPHASLSIDTIQHSAGFFEKFGFQTIQITKDFYAKGLDRYDMVWSAQEERHV
ncbi:MAG: GNAT family N-acetyltransferase [Bacteroidia bacterium]